MDLRFLAVFSKVYLLFAVDPSTSAKTPEELEAERSWVEQVMCDRWKGYSLRRSGFARAAFLCRAFRVFDAEIC